MYYHRLLTTWDSLSSRSSALGALLVVDNTGRWSLVHSRLCFHWQSGSYGARWEWRGGSSRSSEEKLGGGNDSWYRCGVAARGELLWLWAVVGKFHVEQREGAPSEAYARCGWQVAGKSSVHVGKKLTAAVIHWWDHARWRKGKFKQCVVSSFCVD